MSPSRPSSTHAQRTWAEVLTSFVYEALVFFFALQMQSCLPRGYGLAYRCWRALRFKRRTIVANYSEKNRNRELQRLTPSRTAPPKLDRHGYVHWTPAEILDEYEKAKARGLMDHERTQQVMSLLMSQVKGPLPPEPQAAENAALSGCCGVFADIEQRFSPTVEDYTIVMQAYARAKDVEKVLEVFQRMRAVPIEPVQNTYGTLMRAYALVNDEAKAREAFAEMVQRGLCGDHVLFDKVYDALQRM
eukprot:GGOE01049216.1.p1 GENE.GGOE01049216.1~~GGOE01049216.1.p1  ORF type:complete len:246 (-),score=73.82 GGOE01049216.1:172-909(-)